MRILLHIIFILGIAFKSEAQNFVWNKVYGGSDNDFLGNICHGGSKNCIYTSGYFSELNNSKSILPTTNIGTFVLKGKHVGSSQYLAKMDTSGQVIWAKLIFADNGATLNRRGFLSDKKDNLYVIGNLDSKTDSTRILPNSPKIYNPNARTSKNGGITSFIIKLDSSGNFIWQKIFTIGVPDWLILDTNKLYALIRNGSQLFYYSKDTVRNKSLILMEMNDSGQQIVFKGLFDLKNRNNFNIINPIIDSNELIIFSNILGDTIHYNNVSIGYPVLNKQRSSMVKLRFSLSTGNLNESYILTNNSGSTYIKGAIKLGHDHFAVSGDIYDSLCLKSYKKIITQSINQLSFCAIIKNNNIVNVIYSQSILQNQYSQSQFFNIFYNDNFIYLYGNAYRDVMFDGFKTYQNEGSNIFLKVDTLGNVLWVLRTGDSIKYYNPIGFAFDKSNALYFSNDFKKNILMNKLNYYSKDSSVDFLLSKIYDFSITRGNVSKGPYCAGDTLKIPYTKDGNFNLDNVFIAELSDEEGNFTGGHRELGRLKSNKDSFILGVLPLLDVPTSTEYRVRIISTNPQVQSYYRYDSLRLLIYSKDTANAGKDTIVCYGSKVQLKTSGGSKWRWSPGNLVQDSTKRITIIQPITKATRFRIIISDSSGCGKTDTAYKWVLPGSQPLKVYNSDTTLCRGTAKISFIASGGQPSNYQYQWLNKQNKLLSSLKTLIVKDSTPVNLVMVLSDGCTSPNDTLQIALKRYDSLKVVFPKDTAICSSLPVKLIAHAKGGNSSFNYIWRNNTGQIISTLDTLILNSRAQTQFSISVNDDCTSPIDSQGVTIRLYEQLKFVLPNDTQLCFNNKINISPKIINGSKLGAYHFEFDNGIIKDSITAEQVSRALIYNSVVIVSAKDQCNDTVRETLDISVLPKITLNGVIDKEICKNNLVQLKLNVSGGLYPQIIWLDKDSKIIANKSVIDTSFNPLSSTKFTFIASDNCSVPNDTAIMIINVLPELKVFIDSVPYCFKDAIGLHAKVKGGKVTNYNFSWSDVSGKLSSDSMLTYNTKNRISYLFFSLNDQCSEPFFDTIRLEPITIAKFEINDDEQCLVSNQFLFTAKTKIIDSVKTYLEWIVPKEMIISSNNSSLLEGSFLEGNSYRITLKASSKGSCIDSMSAFVNVLPQPKLTILLQNMANENNTNNWFFQAGSDKVINNYQWVIGNYGMQTGNPVYQKFSNNDTGWIYTHLKVIDDNGCEADSSFRFLLVRKPNFFFPNAFSPNDNGLNEDFGLNPNQYFLVKTFHLEVYNRWGEKVFMTDDVAEHWVTSKKLVLQGVYLFKAIITDIYDFKQEISGAVEVLK